jgi:hypothetical protein
MDGRSRSGLSPLIVVVGVATHVSVLRLLSS